MQDAYVLKAHELRRGDAVAVHRDIRPDGRLIVSGVGPGYAPRFIRVYFSDCRSPWLLELDDDVECV